MNGMNPWKLTTIGISLVAVTALSTGVTTAYFMRPGTEAAPAPAPAPAAPAALAAMPQASVVPAVHYVGAPSPRLAPRPVVKPAPRVVRTAAVPVADDCASTGDRVWRIAKPGAIGGLLGAGLGAAGGAIANGGKAAGKGALIGGLAGAVLGGGYGAYKTKAECGSVLGGALATSPIFAAR